MTDLPSPAAPGRRGPRQGRRPLLRAPAPASPRGIREAQPTGRAHQPLHGPGEAGNALRHAHLGHAGDGQRGQGVRRGGDRRDTDDFRPG